MCFEGWQLEHESGGKKLLTVDMKFLRTVSKRTRRDTLNSENKYGNLAMNF